MTSPVGEMNDNLKISNNTALYTFVPFNTTICTELLHSSHAYGNFLIFFASIENMSKCKNDISPRFSIENNLLFQSVLIFMSFKWNIDHKILSHYVNKWIQMRYGKNRRYLVSLWATRWRTTPVLFSFSVDNWLHSVFEV